MPRASLPDRGSIRHVSIPTLISRAPSEAPKLSGTAREAAAGAVSPAAERRLARLFLVFPAVAAIIVLAVAASYAPVLEEGMIRRFHGAKAVSVVRAGLLLVAALVVVPWLARRGLTSLLRSLIAGYASSDAAEAPRTVTVPGVERAVVGLVAALAAVLLLCALWLPRAYRGLIAEDGLLENGSALCWLAAAGTLATAFHWRPRSSPFSWVVYGFLSAFFVVCAGEEISWGQRLMGFHGPEFLLEVNKQRETNLHNIGSISLYANGVFVFACCFFYAVPRLLAGDARLAAYLRMQGLPAFNPALRTVFTVALAAWLVVGVRYGTLGFHPFSLWGNYSQLDDELFEFFLALSFLAFAFLDAVDARVNQAGHRLAT